MWTIIITFFIFGVYWGLSYKLNNDNEVHIKRNFQPITITTVLIVVSILYMVFTKIQLSYLYGNKELPLGFTHAEYARSGLFQLVFSIVLNILSLDANSAMQRAVAEHKISKDMYNNWLNNKKNKQEHWYEYNYYSSSVNK